MSLTKGAKKKGYIIRQDNKEKMTFQFNPSTHDYSRGATYSISKSPGMNVPKIQYVGGNEIAFSTELFMYCVGEKINTVENNIKFIKGLLPPEKNTKKFSKPPEVLICIGTFIRRCVVVNYNVHIEETDKKGHPVVATVVLDLLQVGVK